MRTNETSRRIVAVSVDNLVGFNQTHQTFKVPVMDNAREVFRLVVMFRNDRIHLRHKRVLDRFVDVDVVRRNAGLSGIDELPKRNASGGKGQVGGFIDDGGTFPAQLQGDWGQVLTGRSINGFSNAGAAGKEDVVEGHFG